MGRSGRLTIGMLLVSLAGLIVFLQDQAVDKQALRVIALIFGVPGLLLLVSGIVPGRAAAGTRMTFVPARLFGGLALSLAGVAVLYLYYQVLHVAPRILLIGALLAVPVGFLIAGSCWTEACRACQVPLEEKRERLHADTKTVRAAVMSRRVSEILALRAAKAAGSAVELGVRYCPRCRKLALLSFPGTAGSVLVGDQAAQLLGGMR